MKVFLLSPYQSELVLFMEECGDSVIQEAGIIEENNVIDNGIDFIVCYGYQHIISKNIIERVSGQIINLHISFLPWNRGADPNIWSIVEDTPKGATVHYIDEGIDTGDIIAQARIEFSDNETLESSYWSLRRLIEELFIENWRSIRNGQCQTVKQDLSVGNFHNKGDIKRVLSLLPQGWNTTLREMRQIGIQNTLENSA